MRDGIEIRDARPEDADAVCEIYNHYIRDTVITFELDELTADDLAARFAKIQGAGLPWLVADDGGVVVGYAYAGLFKERAAYTHTVETSIYLAADERGRGIGTAIYAQLLGRLTRLTPAQSPHAPIHVMIGGVALPNEASVALHERFGMRKVAHFEQVGFKFGRWVDVGYWQITSDDVAQQDWSEAP